MLPGLIDAHCHAYGISLDMMATESQPLSYVALAAAQRLSRTLARGFTTVRDPAGEVLESGRTPSIWPAAPGAACKPEPLSPREEPPAEFADAKSSPAIRTFPVPCAIERRGTTTH